MSGPVTEPYSRSDDQRQEHLHLDSGQHERMVYSQVLYARMSVCS